MEKEQVKTFKNRIITATSSDLVVINYEMLMVELEECIFFDEIGDENKFIQSIDRARRVLEELMNNLDFRYSIANELMSLYIFINKKLLEARRKKSAEPLDRIKDILGILLVGWRGAGENVIGEDVSYTNVDAVYVGLTYGPRSLNEDIVSSSFAGIKA